MGIVPLESHQRLIKLRLAMRKSGIRIIVTKFLSEGSKEKPESPEPIRNRKRDSRSNSSLCAAGVPSNVSGPLFVNFNRVESFFKKFWCTFDSQTRYMKLYERQFGKLKDVINLRQTDSIKKSTENSFILKVNATFIEFQTVDDKDLAKWTKAISSATAVNYQSRKRNSASQTKDFCRRLSNGKRSNSTHYLACNLSESDNPRQYLSPLSDYILGVDGEVNLSSGRIKDIIKWCILGCKERSKTIDVMALFLVYGILELPVSLDALISKTWQQWDKPVLTPSVQERFVNFVVYYLESPIVKSYGEDMKERMAIRELIHKEYKGGRVTLMGANLPPELFISSSIETYDVIEEDSLRFPVHEIASQITIYESEWFRKITVHELILEKTLTAESSPVLHELIGIHNKFSRWATWHILEACGVKKQVAVFQKLEQLSQTLHELQNYNSCSAIINGLLASPIRRLTDLMEKIPEKCMDNVNRLRKIYSSENNYQVYRELPTIPVCIPLLDVYLGDITKVKHATRTILDEELCVFNFQKMKELAAITLRLVNIDMSLFSFDLDVNSLLKRYIMNINPPSSAALMELSCAIPVPKEFSPDVELIMLRAEKKQLERQLESMKEQKKQDIAKQQELLRNLMVDGKVELMENTEAPFDLLKVALGLLAAQ